MKVNKLAQDLLIVFISFLVVFLTTAFLIPWLGIVFLLALVIFVNREVLWWKTAFWLGIWHDLFVDQPIGLTSLKHLVLVFVTLLILFRLKQRQQWFSR